MGRSTRGNRWVANLNIPTLSKPKVCEVRESSIRSTRESSSPDHVWRATRTALQFWGRPIGPGGCQFTTVVGVFLAWITLRGESVWPAVIGHAVINTTTPLVILLDVDMPQYLIGPVITGVVGSVPFAVVACWLLLRDGSFAVPMRATQE